MFSIRSEGCRQKSGMTTKIRGHLFEHLMAGSTKMTFSKRLPIARAILLAAFLPGIGWAQTQNSRPAQPGTVNYVEGQASVDNQPLSSTSVGSTQLQAGQTLETQSGGKVEVLLTPGVFLRVDDNSTIKMVKAGLADTEVE